jgi:hypothetical protein
MRVADEDPKRVQSGDRVGRLDRLTSTDNLRLAEGDRIGRADTTEDHVDSGEAIATPTHWLGSKRSPRSTTAAGELRQPMAIAPCGRIIL